MGDQAAATVVVTAWEAAMPKEAKDSWEATKRDRRAIRSRVSKAITLLNNTLAEDSAEEEDIEVTLQGVKDALVALEEIEARIWRSIQAKDDAQEEAVMEADRLLGEKWTRDASKAVAKG